MIGTGLLRLRAGHVCRNAGSWLKTSTRSQTERRCTLAKPISSRRLASYAVTETATAPVSLDSTVAPPPPAGSDATGAENMGNRSSSASSPKDRERGTPSGKQDDSWFEQHWSVEHWRPRRTRKVDEVSDLSELAATAARSAQQANVLQDRTAASYWAYHTARWAYFLTQAASSVILSSARSGELAQGRLMITRPLDSSTSLQVAWNISAEAFGTFECDLRNIKEGAYKLPWDMTTPGHRQFNPLYVLRQSMLYLQEAPQVLGRRREPEGKVGLLPFERSPLYPDYYQNNFHFQTDGWFSSRSAEVYEVATETLFAGRQDAMQRGTLLALNRHFPGSNGVGLEMLEVGAGTGRVATFVRDNYPAASLTVSDLSPFYLQKARDNMSHWERCASPSARSAGTAAFLQCAAEALPQADASLDVVYTVYMFHEMPDDARRAALHEFARVLKPGGVLIITDSVQEGDREAFTTLRAFGGFNEPHYEAYVDFSFGPEMDAVGLQPCFKSMASSSKTVSATKR